MLKPGDRPQVHILNELPHILSWSEEKPVGAKEVENNVWLRPYDFPGIYKKPRLCQVQMTVFDLRNPRYWNLSEMRTGKTAGSLWPTDIKMKYGNTKKVLIIVPKVAIDNTWRKEIFGVMPNVSTFYSTGGSTEPVRQALKAGKHQMFVINYDKFWRVLPEILMWRPDRVICDEASECNDRTSKRAKNLSVLLKKEGVHDFVALTGTPMPNRPTDMWSVGRHICDTLPTFKQFESEVMAPAYQIKPGVMKMVPRPGSSQTVAKYLVPSIRIKTEDVNELPPQESRHSRVNMGGKQKTMFKEMKKDFITQDKGKVITAEHAATQITKLLQITSGVVYSTTGEPVVCGSQPKIDECRRNMLEASGKTLIFCRYKPVQKYIMDQLKGFDLRLINGDTDDEHRIRYMHEFQQGNVNGLVLGPDVVKYSVQLDAASQSIWFGPVYSNMVFTQASARMRGIATGVYENTLNITLSCSDFEDAVYEHVAKNFEAQESAMTDAADIYRALILENEND